MTTAGEAPVPWTEPHLAERARKDPDAHRAALASRRAQFLELHDLTKGRGLEIGPLDSGIADRQVDDVRYVDVFDAEGLRAHYAEDVSVLLDLIPDIDFPIYLDGTARELRDVAAPGGPYDWVLASHVIEHVPDMIGWLRQLAEIVSDDARLLLAVPDRRYCFDRHRPPTTVGQALEAFEQHHTRPSLRAVYDFFSAAVDVDTESLWRGERPPGRSAARHRDPAVLVDALEAARQGAYVDCHVWTFTPESFLEQIRELRERGLGDWYVEKVIPRPGTVEFHAVLRRVPRGWSGEPLPEQDSASDLPDWLAQEWDSVERQRELEERVHRLEERVSTLRGRVARLKARNERLRGRLRLLESAPSNPLSRKVAAFARHLGRA